MFPKLKTSKHQVKIHLPPEFAKKSSGECVSSIGQKMDRMQFSNFIKCQLKKRIDTSPERVLNQRKGFHPRT